MDNIKENEIENVLTKIVYQYKDKIPKLLEIFAETLSISTDFFEETTSKNVINEIFDKFIKASSNSKEINEIAESPKKKNASGSFNRQQNNPSPSLNILAPKSPDLDFSENNSGDDDDDDCDSTYIPETQLEMESSEDILYVAPSELNSMRPQESQLVVDFMDIDNAHFTSILSNNSMNKSIGDYKKCNERNLSTQKEQPSSPPQVTILNDNQNRDDCRSTTPDLIFENLDDRNDDNSKKKIKTSVTDSFCMAETQIFDIANVISSNSKSPSARLDVVDDNGDDPYMAATQIFDHPSLSIKKSKSNQIFSDKCDSLFVQPKLLPSKAKNHQKSRLLENDPNMAETQMFDIANSSSNIKSSARLDNGDDDGDDPYMAATQMSDHPSLTIKKSKSSEIFLDKCDSPFVQPKLLPPKAKKHHQVLDIDPNMASTLKTPPRGGDVDVDDFDDDLCMAETQSFDIANISNKSKSPARLDNGDGDDPYLAATQIFDHPSLSIKKSKSNELHADKSDSPFLLPKGLPLKAKKHHQSPVLDINPNMAETKNVASETSVRIVDAVDDDFDDDLCMAETQILEPTIQSNSSAPSNIDISNKETSPSVESKNNISKYIIDYNDKLFDDSLDFLKNNDNDNENKQLCMDETQMFEENDEINKAPHDDDIFNVATQLLIPPTPSKPTTKVQNNNLPDESKTNKENQLKNNFTKNDRIDKKSKINNQRRPSVDIIDVDTPQFELIKRTKPHKIIKAESIYQNMRKQLVKKPKLFIDSSDDDDDDGDDDDGGGVEEDKGKQLNVQAQETIINKNESKTIENVKKPNKFVYKIPSSLQRQTYVNNSGDNDRNIVDNKNSSSNNKSNHKDELPPETISTQKRKIPMNRRKSIATNELLSNKQSSHASNNNITDNDRSDAVNKNSNNKKCNIKDEISPETILPQKRKVPMNRRKSIATNELLTNKQSLSSKFKSPVRTRQRSKTIDSKSIEPELSIEKLTKNNSKRQQSKPVNTSTNKSPSDTKTATKNDQITRPKLLNSRKPTICELFGENDSSDEEKEQQRPKRARKAIILADCISHKEQKIRNKPKEQKKYKVTADNSPSNTVVANPNDECRSNRQKKPRILFTQLDPKPFIDVIQSLGGFVVQTPDKCDILITNRIYRTYKFLSAIGKGAKIVDVSWLREVLHSNKFVDTDKYLLVDKKSEKKYGFNLNKSLERARSVPLFDNYSIYVTPNTQPLPMELQYIIECAGGTCLLDIKQLPCHRNDKIITVSCQEDQKLWSIYRRKYPSMLIINTEGFMLSIMRQYICFEGYIICK